MLADMNYDGVTTEEELWTGIQIIQGVVWELIEEGVTGELLVDMVDSDGSGVIDENELYAVMDDICLYL